MKTQTKINNIDKIQSFLVSLHYLSKEADREGFPRINEILVDAINSIQNWMDGNDTIDKCEIFDTSIYYAIEFLNKFSALPKNSQKALVCLFDDMEEKELLKRCSNRQKEFH